ncbi:LYR motif-containing protein [Acrasis kona]|uniref:LYR motif-containing protein n=1 Tax=Acrasis kona TaxID=1008807 RepID=A0AAW2YWV6_9EUKA
MSKQALSRSKEVLSLYRKIIKIADRYHSIDPTHELISEEEKQNMTLHNPDLVTRVDQMIVMNAIQQFRDNMDEKNPEIIDLMIKRGYEEIISINRIMNDYSRESWYTSTQNKSTKDITQVLTPLAEKLQNEQNQQPEVQVPLIKHEKEKIKMIK